MTPRHDRSRITETLRVRANERSCSLARSRRDPQWRALFSFLKIPCRGPPMPIKAAGSLVGAEAADRVVLVTRIGTRRRIALTAEQGLLFCSICVTRRVAAR